jgi:hypothetical protein
MKMFGVLYLGTQMEGWRLSADSPIMPTPSVFCFLVLHPDLFLSILSIKHENWFYWADKGGKSRQGGNQRISCIHPYLRLSFLRIRDLQK